MANPVTGWILHRWSEFVHGFIRRTFCIIRRLLFCVVGAGVDEGRGQIILGIVRLVISTFELKVRGFDDDEHINVV